MAQGSLGILDGISNPNMQDHSRSHSLWSSGLIDSDDKVRMNSRMLRLGEESLEVQMDSNLALSP